MNFNSDPIEQAQGIIFSRKLHDNNHLCLIFNHNTVNLTESQKHLGIRLDSRLDFKECLQITFKKGGKATALLRKLQDLLPRKSSIIIYQSVIKPHLDYGGILYDQAYNASFRRKLEMIQCNGALTITGAIRGTSKEKLHQELKFESLQQRP